MTVRRQLHSITSAIPDKNVMLSRSDAEILQYLFRIKISDSLAIPKATVDLVQPADYVVHRNHRMFFHWGALVTFYDNIFTIHSKTSQ